MRHCGFEVWEAADGFDLKQTAYAKESVEKWGVQEKAEVPVFKAPEEEEEPDPTMLRRAQAITKGLLWLATKTRPERCLLKYVGLQYTRRLWLRCSGPCEREAARQAAGGFLGHQLRNGWRPQERAGDPGLLRGIANRLGGDQAALCGAIYGGGGADRLLQVAGGWKGDSCFVFVT